MKKTLLTLVLLGATIKGMAQNDQLQDNINLKLGIIGGWIAYEKAFGDNFLIDTELGYVGGILNNDFVFTSTIELEPRYYYNLKSRLKKGKNIDYNAANYLSLQMAYFPDWLTQSTGSGDVEVAETLNIIPSYGLRRSISGKLHFDFEIGLGYQIAEGGNDLVANLTLALSYMLD